MEGGSVCEADRRALKGRPNENGTVATFRARHGERPASWAGRERLKSNGTDRAVDVADVAYTGEIYNVNVNFPYTRTLFNNAGINISGASQILSCCDVNLIPSPVNSYNCNNGNCYFISGPSGLFPTLAACQAGCQPVTSYNCTNGNCVLVSGSSGQYPNLLACQTACIPPEVNTIYTTFDII
jgi:hypothetical protein